MRRSQPALLLLLAFGCGMRLASPEAPSRLTSGPPCASSEDCQRPAEPCFVAVCAEGICQTEVAVAGTVPAEQKAGDCQALVCDGRGQAIAREDRDDPPPSDENDCTEERCARGAPEHAPLDAGAACGTGGVCNGAGICGVCVPGERRCEGNTAKTCAADGRWGDASACAGAAPVCSAGACVAPVELALGESHTCARLTNGTARCWGANRVHQVDGGNRHSLPLGGVLDLALGEAHGCARLAAGAVKCWGDNTWGQLGDGSGQPQAEPVSVRGIGGAAQIAAGAKHTCARLDDGTVRCWGNNHAGQLGDGGAGPPPQATEPYGRPTLALMRVAGAPEKVTVRGPAPMVQIALFGERSCARYQNLTAECWGGESPIAPGPKSAATSQGPPKLVRGLKGAVQIALGGDHSCARLADGSVQCWGENQKGQIGDGSLAARRAPARVRGIAEAEEIALGREHTCAREKDGSVQCWGANAKGQLGDGTRTDRRLPGPVQGLAGVVALAAGGDHTCALLANGEVKCWGDNTGGALGDGTAEGRSAPVEVTW